MDKKHRADLTRSGGLAYFPAVAQGGYLAGSTSTAGESHRAPGPLGSVIPGSSGAPRGEGEHARAEILRAFRGMEADAFTVRGIAECLDWEARRLAELYARLVHDWKRCGPGHPGDLDARLVSPLVAHLGQGVQVSDIHKILNVARDPIFEDRDPNRGKTSARAFSVEQAVSIYVLWRLGHSFQLAPKIRQAVARQLTKDVLRRIMAGEDLGLALTPFVAAIGSLEEMLATRNAEIVAFSLNGLICQAILAFRSHR